MHYSIAAPLLKHRTQRLDRHGAAIVFMLLALMIFLVSSGSAFGASLNKTFSLERKQFNQGYCNISAARLELRISESFGEPMIASQFTWQAGPNTAKDCLPNQLDLWVEWRGQDNQMGFMPVSVKTAASGAVGEERLSSPGWSGVLCQTRTFPPRCYGSEAAKQFLLESETPQSFHLGELTLGREMPTSVQPMPKQAANPSRKLNLNDQFENRLNQSIDSLLSADVGTSKREGNRVSTSASNNSGVEGLVSLINDRLGLFERVAPLCSGSIKARYTATRLHECGLSIQTEMDLSPCDETTDSVIKRHRVELDFSERPVSNLSLNDHTGYSSLTLVLNDALVMGSDQAVNLLVISAEAAQEEALAELEKSIDTLQALCALGKD